MSMTIEQKQRLLNSSDKGNELVLIGQRIGVEALTAVLDILGGTTGCETYIPSPQNFFGRLQRDIRDADIRERWTHGNTSDLAAQYGISPRRVLQIVQLDPNTREVD